MNPVVEITTSGRGGSIKYREGDHTIVFDWEFAMDPVGAEVVRQKAPGGAFEYDLDRGELTIYGSDRGRGR
jgi:hypothetical protein